jgi:predicted GTPase
VNVPDFRVSLSLISHTNVGKTTLARTLLRREIGEVRDEAHVTETADAFTLIETPQGDVLRLWDTPGFGDSARLSKRLRQSGNPLGWFLTQVWDRYVDRPFFSSQQAIRNVRDEADVVLYLVNASEDPEAAGYVDAEMQILGWIGKPVIVLLNQLGSPRPADAEAADVLRWSAHLAGHPWVRDTIAFDAFARCWVQEHVLLERIGAVLPAERREAYARLADAWKDRNRRAFEQSMQVLARHLAATATDAVAATAGSVAIAARSWLSGLLRSGERSDPGVDAAMGELAARLDGEVRRATDELIAAHGLSGHATAEIMQRMGAEFAVDKAADPAKASVIGAAVSGALGGLAADLAAGGLTFGAGALLGGLLGAAGARGLASAYNLARGSDATAVRWSGGFLTGRVAAAVLRYLAVAHFGRGRGDFVASEYPRHWGSLVATVIEPRRGLLDGIWSSAARGEPATVIELRLRAPLESIAEEVLERLYPSAAGSTGPTLPG